ncbi:MAG: DUF4981 domain-containing protein, partial [Bacteroidota bacterium]|nr:DUF4981 domain-containing protein [Bacteroidota bacterium]
VYVDSKINPKNVNGIVEIENRYLYTNLNKCRFVWKLVSFAGSAAAKATSKIVQTGKGTLPATPPGEKGNLHIPLRANNLADALYLSTYDSKGNTICTWSWPLKTPAKLLQANRSVAKMARVSSKEDAQFLVVNVDNIAYYFDKETGFIAKVANGKKQISFSGGPSLAGNRLTLDNMKCYKQGEEFIVEPRYEGDSLKVKWIFRAGTLPQLKYSYITKDTADFMGITFNYPEEKIDGMRWMGRGPYRVWKNRLKGQQFGVWEKGYNNTITGQDWKYPEFKGWHSELYWVRLKNKESDFTIYTDQQNIYLQMLQPERAKASGNNNTSPPFPAGNIGFMHAISAIGTKFQKAEVMGPQSQKNGRNGSVPLTGSLYFDFR